MRSNGTYKSRAHRLEEEMIKQQEAAYDQKLDRILAHFDIGEVAALTAAVEKSIEADYAAMFPDLTEAEQAASDKFDKLGGGDLLA